MRTLLCFAAALFVVCPTLAAPEDALDPSVAFVTTGGYWPASRKSDAEHGHYRVVVTNGGWEHVSSRVRLEWILEDPNSKSTKVLKSVEVKELSGGMWSVGQPSFAGAAAITLSATQTYTSKGQTFTLKPLAVGNYSLERK